LSHVLARRRGFGAMRLPLLTALVAASCAATPAGTVPTGSPAATVLPSPAIPTLANVSLDATHAGRQVIGRDGGTIEISDAKGTSYRLVIPAGALRRETEIAMIPVTGITGLPDAAAVAGGVHLLPEGQTFGLPVELVVTFGTAPGGAILPFAYSGDLSEPHRYPAPVDGASATFGIVHFSGYGLLAATNEAMAAAELDLIIPWIPPAGPADAALAAIAPIYELVDDPNRDQKINAIMKTWLEDGVKPAVDRFLAVGTWGDFGGHWDVTGLEAGASLLLWDYLETLFKLVYANLDPSLSAAVDALELSTVVHGIEVTNTNCAVTPIDRLIEARLPWEWVWLLLADSFGLADDDPRLTVEYVSEHLCAQVEFDPSGGTDFPSGIQAGQVGTLNLKVGMSIDGGPVRFEAPMDVTILPSGVAPGGVVHELTSDAGALSHTFGWDVSSPELRLDISACINHLPDVCQAAFVIRGAAAACPHFEVSLRSETQANAEGVSISGAYAFPGSAFVNLAGDGTGTARTTTVWRFDSGGGPARVEAMLEVKASIEDFTSPSQQGKPHTASISLSGAGSFTMNQVGERSTQIPITLLDDAIISLTGIVSAAAAADTGISASLDFQFVNLPADAEVERVSCTNATPTSAPTLDPGVDHPA